MLIVPLSSPAHSVRDLIELATQQPGQLSYGAPGVGTTGHMGGELFKHMAKIDTTFVPYNSGTAAMQDLLGGRIDYMFANSSEADPMIKSGKVRALGVSSLNRIALFPEVPTIDESGLKGYETVAWGGVVVPRGTPKDIVAKLNENINLALQTPDVQRVLAELGAQPAGGSPEDFATFIESERVKWGDIIKHANIGKVD